MFTFAFVPGRNDPFLSPWPELYGKTFETREAAERAAEAFVSAQSAGGFDKETQCYWAREDNGDLHRLTQFEIRRA